MFSVKILADSINETANRLTTFELTYPRFVHAQLMTHRLFSRNAASSRAIPTRKLLERVRNNVVMPLEWGKNQRGMQADGVLDEEAREACENDWLQAAGYALHFAERIAARGAHKQIANRLLEPFMYITVIVSATEYSNWFHLRGADAQPEIQWVAQGMFDAMEESVPVMLAPGDWHLPLIEQRDARDPLYVSAHELDPNDKFSLIKISVARCARVSYLTHDGQRDLSADIGLHDRLAKNGHWSPFEHAAMAMASDHRFGNFFGFKQYRKLFAEEHYGREMD